MKTTLAFTLLALLALSSIAFAGQENRGGAYYGNKIATCDSGTLNVSVYHNEAAGFFTALVTETPDAESVPFGVREILPAPHHIGGGRSYEGKGFELSICTDCWQPAGIPGSLKVPSLKIDESVHCLLK